MSVVNKFVLIFCIYGSLNLVIQIFKKCCVLIDFSLDVSFFISDSSVTISRKIVVFSLFPSQFECVHRLKNKSPLIVGKLPVLTHGVKAHNKLLFESQERRRFNDRPFSNFRFKWFVVG